MYSVEGSLVFSICFLTLMGVILLGFRQYSTGVTYVRDETPAEEREAAITFRNFSYALEYVDAGKENNNTSD